MSSERKENHQQVIYLHHLPLNKPLNLGGFVLWPYHKSRDAFVKELKIRKYLDQLFHKMCDFRNRPLKHIAVLSDSTSPSFSPASRETFSKMNDVVNALFFSAVMENNAFAAVSSDNFYLITQNFTPRDDGWGITDGSYIQITLGGLKLKDAGVRLPPRETYLRDFRYDAELLDGCMQCLMNGENSLRKRVFSSLKWFASSYDNNPKTQYHSRILLLMVAFEMLGAYPGAFTAKKFAGWLDKLFEVRADKKSFSETKMNLGPYGPPGWWGIEFYKLRNDIIHNNCGSDNPPVFDSHGREYFKTGVYIFCECVKEILVQNMFLKKSVYTNVVRAWRLSRGSRSAD